jgi:hypothetical protein
VAYLKYLQYWSRPPYLKYLTYPGPALRHLEMLQSERFRQEIISPEVAQRLADETARAAVEWHASAAAAAGGPKKDAEPAGDVTAAMVAMTVRAREAAAAREAGATAGVVGAAAGAAPSSAT